MDPSKIWQEPRSSRCFSLFFHMTWQQKLCTNPRSTVNLVRCSDLVQTLFKHIRAKDMIVPGYPWVPDRKSQAIYTCDDSGDRWCDQPVITRALFVHVWWPWSPMMWFNSLSYPWYCPKNQLVFLFLGLKPLMPNVLESNPVPWSTENQEHPVNGPIVSSPPVRRSFWFQPLLQLCHTPP